MTVCRFYLQGRCRYGDRCWNEHTDPSPAPQRRDQYSWVSPAVSSSRNYSQDNFSKGNFSNNYRGSNPRSDYGYDSNQSSTPTRNQYSDRQGWSNTTSGYYDHRSSESYGRSNAPKKNTSFQLKPANRFEVLSQVNDAERDSGLISTVRNDISEWEESQIWPFSCHSHFKDLGECLSGFVDMSPEELRYTAYEAERNGAFTFYTGIVADALNEVKKKWNVLKNPTLDVLHSIKGYQGTPDFCEENLRKLIPESGTSPFNGGQINTGMFAQDNVEPASSSGSFSFKLAHLDSSQSLGSSTSAFKSVFPTANKEGSSLSSFGVASSGFGLSSSSSVFASPSTSSVPTNFGSSSGLASSLASSVPSGFGSSSKERQTAADSEMKSCAYTQMENLTDNEKNQFSSQTFTLGKIPSRPPPIEFCF